MENSSHPMAKESGQERGAVLKSDGHMVRAPGVEGPVGGWDDRAKRACPSKTDSA